MSEKRFKAPILSPGVVIGKLYFLCLFKEKNEKKSPCKVEEEVSFFRLALQNCRADLENIKEKLSKDVCEEVIGSHIALLEDPMMTDYVESRIRTVKVDTAGTVFRSVIKEYEERFNRLNDAFFKERFVDVYDVSARILAHLEKRASSCVKKAKSPSIFVTERINPSEAASAPGKKSIGFITQHCGDLSHAALIVRARGLPTLSSFPIEELAGFEGKTAILDGNAGLLIVNPEYETLKEYRRSKKNQILLEDQVKSATKEGTKLNFYASVGNIHDVDSLKSYSVAGIGLFRTEFLVFEEGDILDDEKKQYRLYLKALEKMDPLPVIFRAFDFGGDKPHSLVAGKGRGLSLLLEEKKSFKKQIRALLLVSKKRGQSVQFLLPLVESVEQMQRALDLIEEEKELVGGSLRVGAMVETPDIVEEIEDLGKIVDFFAIGTNDLLERLFGFNRDERSTDSLLSYAADPLFLQLLKRIFQSIEKTGKSVHLCGEIGAEPSFVPLLVGLGARSFSVPARFCMDVMRSASSFTLEESKHMVELALKGENVYVT